MLAIQESLIRDMGWHIDCGIEEAVKSEMREKVWRPRADQLERWGVELDSDSADDDDEEDDDDDEGEGEDDENEDKGQETHLCCTVM
jgi:TATA-binding protein-associated factor Taf7